MADRSSSATRPAFGAAVAYVVAVCSALLAFALGDRETTHEYPFLLLWSVPPALIVYPVARLLRGGVAARAALGVVLGIGIGVAWTAAAYVQSGGYLLAADFPVFWCWTWGAVAGILTAGVPHTRRGSIAAAVALMVVASWSGAAWWRASRPTLAVDVLLQPSTTPDDVERVWQEVLGRPHPGGGYALLEGVRSIARADTADIPRLLVDMDTFASEADSATLDARLRHSPLVASVRWHRRPR
ncbi:MAG TPA: hypothetical protein VIR34_05090 [Gemmatimonadaceae bacterium]|jgi:hypothetical protein